MELPELKRLLPVLIEGNPRPIALGANSSSLDVGLLPAGVNAKAFCLRERITFGELDANWGEHRTAVADVGTRERGLLARFVDWAVGPVEVKYTGEYVLSTRRHRGSSLHYVAWSFLRFVSYSPICGCCGSANNGNPPLIGASSSARQMK